MVRCNATRESSLDHMAPCAPQRYCSLAEERSLSIHAEENRGEYKMESCGGVNPRSVTSPALLFAAFARRL